MLNERTAELIQADIDGELAESDRVELTAALEQSAEARQFREEMARVANLMADTPDVDLPWGLRRRILDSIKLPSPSRLSVLSSLWTGPASYGLAVAAGVLIAVGVARVAPQSPEDLNGLVGTMVSKGSEITRSASSELEIDLDSVQGKVRLKDLEQAFALEFDLQSSETVEVTVNLGETGLRFGGFANQDASVENFEVSGESVRVMNQGDHRFVLFLRSMPGTGEGPQEIGIVVSHQGDTVYRGLLESRG